MQTTCLVAGVAGHKLVRYWAAAITSGCVGGVLNGFHGLCNQIRIILDCMYHKTTLKTYVHFKSRRLGCLYI
jgi:hypothetical protein